jgi:transposase InsO family protein
VKYACIARHQGEVNNVRLMCRLLGVSPAGFYAMRQQHQGRRAPSARTQANQRLLAAIRGAHAASGRRYGAPLVHAELRAQGVRCGHNRVARLMHQNGLRGLAPRRFRVTTQSGHREPIAANVLARRFAPAAYRERDRVWVADLTYLGTREGWLYLAVVLDLASRRVLGWCADRRLDHSLPLRALERALTLRRPRPGLIHHSDRGVQYASRPYQQRLHAHGIVPSMSRAGDCWDNAVVESFFATLKRELVASAHWTTRAEAHRALLAYIDRWYNHQRRHSALGFLSPVDYERQLAQVRTA